MAPDTPYELAESIADYMATRNNPWLDQEEMREAVHEAVRLLYTEAIFEAYPLMKAAYEERHDGPEVAPTQTGVQ